MRSGSDKKLLILVDSLNFFSGLRLFLLTVGKRCGGSIRYMGCDTYGHKWLAFLRLVGLCSDVEELAPNLTKQMPTGGSVWDWLHETVQTSAKVIAERIETCDTFMNYLPSTINTERKVSFLRKMIQLEIYNLLILVDCAKQEHRERIGDTETIILVNLSDLAPFLQEIVKDHIRIGVIGYSDFRSLLGVRLVWFLAVQISQIVRRSYAYWLTKGNKIDIYPATVGVQYSHGLDGFSYGASDLWWYPNSGLKPNQCLLLFDRPRPQATDEVVSYLRDRGYRYRILKSVANGSSGLATEGFPAQDAVRTVADLLSLCKIVLRAWQFVSPIWQISRWLVVLVNLRRWQNLMEVENIKVLFSAEQTSLDAMSLAADLVGAIRVGYHWSDLYPANARLVPLQQVFFVWGPRYQSALVNRLGGCSEVIVQAGCVFDDRNSATVLQERGATFRQKLQSGDIKHIVGVLDRSLGRTSFYPADGHIRFYKSIFTWAESQPDIGLLIKPKHENGPKVLEYAPELSSQLDVLISKGQAILLEGNRSVLEVGFASDVMISLGYNSGGTVCALNGARSVFWDPAELHKGSLGEWFRRVKWNNQNLVFTDMDRLIQSVQRFFESPSTIPDLGDLSPILDEIDPFRDGASSLRVGSFVRCFLEATENGMDREGALQHAVSEYREIWGKEKVLVRDDHNSMSL